MHGVGVLGPWIAESGLVVGGDGQGGIAAAVCVNSLLKVTATPPSSSTAVAAAKALFSLAAVSPEADQVLRRHIVIGNDEASDGHSLLTVLLRTLPVQTFAAIACSADQHGGQVLRGLIGALAFAERAWSDGGRMSGAEWVTAVAAGTEAVRRVLAGSGRDGNPLAVDDEVDALLNRWQDVRVAPETGEQGLIAALACLNLGDESAVLDLPTWSHPVDGDDDPLDPAFATAAGHALVTAGRLGSLDDDTAMRHLVAFAATTGTIGLAVMAADFVRWRTGQVRDCRGVGRATRVVANAVIAVGEAFGTEEPREVDRHRSSIKRLVRSLLAAVASVCPAKRVGTSLCRLIAARPAMSACGLEAAAAALSCLPSSVKAVAALAVAAETHLAAGGNLSQPARSLVADFVKRLRVRTSEGGGRGTANSSSVRVVVAAVLGDASADGKTEIKAGDELDLFVEDGLCGGDDEQTLDMVSKAAISEGGLLSALPDLC